MSVDTPLGSLWILGTADAVTAVAWGEGVDDGPASELSGPAAASLSVFRR